uniref:Uncharacterized protein n=1 Tax=Panagrolaimus davidi TaxID=227884 RepID=A0A914R1L3_9BILA
MCYIFHRVFGKENKYCCNGCRSAKNKECTVLDEFGQKIKGVVYVYLCKDSDGKLSVKLPSHQHICEPKKYRNIKAPKQRSLKFDKSKIIRKPNFELQKNTKGDPKGKLVVFDTNDKSLCYEYCLANNIFYCGRCRFKKNHVTAKLYPPSIGSNETDEYIVLGENQHVCELVKYESHSCFDASNFLIFYQNDKSKLAKVILFTSPSKEYCYEFTWHETAKHFFCYPCKSSDIKKHVTGKLINGNFEMFTKNEHSCKPKKFVLEKYQPKTIPESLFELGSSNHGKPNAKLYLFTSEKKEFFYEFYSTGLPQFICLQCITIDKTLYVKVKLVENENGEKYLGIDSTKEHIYQPKK